MCILDPVFAQAPVDEIRLLSMHIFAEMLADTTIHCFIERGCAACRVVWQTGFAVLLRRSRCSFCPWTTFHERRRKLFPPYNSLITILLLLPSAARSRRFGKGSFELGRERATLGRRGGLGSVGSAEGACDVYHPRSGQVACESEHHR